MHHENIHKLVSFKIPKAKSGMSEHKNVKKNIWTSIIFFHETMFKITIMQSDTTVVSIAAIFFKKAAIIIATHGQKTLHWQLSKVILSGMYNCNFEAIN